jgi:peptidoglycan/LPS O-acetylase OafA/YrhL
MTPRPELPALTSLRFFAAFYVVLFHATPGLVHATLAKSVLGTGYVAVDLFFVLSGFVLAYKYTGDDGALVGTRRAFWAARVARVYPVYLLSLVIGAPLYLAALHEGASLAATAGKAAVAGAAALALVQGWYYRIATAWNTPAWSLSVEAFLYLAFPFALPRLVAALRRRAGWIVVAALWAAAMALPLAHLVASGGAAGIDTKSPLVAAVRLMPLFHLPAFLIGVVAGVLHLRRRAPSPAWLPWLTAGAIGAALCAGAWLPYFMLQLGLLAPLFAAFLYAIAGARGPVVRALGARPLTALGDASYALYLLHFPALRYAERLAGGPLPAPQLVAVIAALQLVCLAVYRGLEAPARRWLRARLAARVTARG